MRRRRSPRVVWLPQDPFFNINGAGLGDSTVNKVVITHSPANIGDASTAIAPIVLDGNQNPLAAGKTLADIEQSGYRLRRIVGKMFVDADQTNTTAARTYLATAGFIVLRIDEQTNLPLAVATPEKYDTMSILNTADPWIWRRSWYLTNFVSASVSGIVQALSQNVGGSNHAGDGGNSDGPHVDQKTARVIGPEERLFASFTVTNLDAPTDPQASAQLVQFVYDCRYLGSMRSSAGNRRNASR